MSRGGREGEKVKEDHNRKPDMLVDVSRIVWYAEGKAKSAVTQGMYCTMHGMAASTRRRQSILDHKKPLRTPCLKVRCDICSLLLFSTSTRYKLDINGSDVDDDRQCRQVKSSVDFQIVDLESLSSLRTFPSP